MAEEGDHQLSTVVGGKSVGENLERAIASGKVIRGKGGELELARLPKGGDELALDPYITRYGDFAAPCAFLNRFMFQYVYAEKAVPFGCRDCYKVKVVSDTMRQLMAVKEISESVSCTAKSGPEMYSMQNQHLYGTYFYNWGLNKARELYKIVRAKVDAHPKLGPTVNMLIKRGCTNYERACGPSDKYTFDPKLRDVEDFLAPKFVRPPARLVDKATWDRTRVLEMIQAAYRIGDDTYKDFNGGRSLYPPNVTYDPENQSL
jgi:hypothetical protein